VPLKPRRLKPRQKPELNRAESGRRTAMDLRHAGRGRPQAPPARTQAANGAILTAASWFQLRPRMSRCMRSAVERVGQATHLRHSAPGSDRRGDQPRCTSQRSKRCRESGAVPRPSPLLRAVSRCSSTSTPARHPCAKTDARPILDELRERTRPCSRPSLHRFTRDESPARDVGRERPHARLKMVQWPRRRVHQTSARRLREPRSTRLDGLRAQPTGR